MTYDPTKPVDTAWVRERLKGMAATPVRHPNELAEETCAHARMGVNLLCDVLDELRKLNAKTPTDNWEQANPVRGLTTKELRDMLDEAIGATDSAGRGLGKI